MFENYLASFQDLKAVENGLLFAWNKKFYPTFSNKRLIEKIPIISFDSKFLYVWSKQKFSGFKQEITDFNQYHLFKIPHSIHLIDSDYSYWVAAIPKKEFYKYLPKFFTIKSQQISPRICGSPLTPFIKIHQKMKETKEYPYDAYTTKESYLATIVHEFAHCYFEQQFSSWHGVKSYNLKLIQNAIELYEKNKNSCLPKIQLPVSNSISELFAFCAEYSAAKILWPTHLKNIDYFVAEKLKQLIKKEKTKNLNLETSVIDEDSHCFASIAGKIIMHKYPYDWQSFIYKQTLNTLNN